METLSCSSSCTDVRNPIKLCSGCSTERYLMRQRYLRSYPLMSKKKEKLAGIVAKRTKKWLKEIQRKYCRRRFNDQENKQTRRLRRPAVGDQKSKPNPGSSSSYVEACLKLLLVCMAKVDVAAKMENPKSTGFGTKKAVIS